MVQTTTVTRVADGQFLIELENLARQFCLIDNCDRKHYEFVAASERFGCVSCCWHNVHDVLALVIRLSHQCIIP